MWSESTIQKIPMHKEPPEVVVYLYIKVRRYVRVADLVLQLESSAEDRITETAFWR